MRWEYKLLYAFDEAYMNELGLAGWECVSAVHIPYGQRAVIVMKREI